MSQLNQMKTKNNMIVYRIKNTNTGLYYKKIDYKHDAETSALAGYPQWKRIPIYDKEGRFFNTEVGARRCISELTGKSFTKYSKMSPVEKVLKGAESHSNYEIVKTKITFKDIK